MLEDVLKLKCFVCCEVSSWGRTKVHSLTWHFSFLLVCISNLPILKILTSLCSWYHSCLLCLCSLITGKKNENNYFGTERHRATGECSKEPLRWWRDWSTSHMRKGWESQHCPAWRREGQLRIVGVGNGPVVTMWPQYEYDRTALLVSKTRFI